MKTKFELTPKYPNRCIITEDKGHDYNYKPIKEYLEVSLDFDGRGEDGKYNMPEWHYRLMATPTDTLARWVHRPEDYVSVESIVAAQKAITKLQREEARNIREGKKTQAWKDIMTLTKETGWPIHYKTDLIHDAESLGMYHPEKFLYAIREAGTWLFTQPWQCREWLRGIVANAPKDQKYYLYDGGEWTELSANEWANYLL